MTTLETLTAEKADLENQINVQETVIETATRNIKFLKKRLKVTEEQIKETPEEIKPVG